LTDPATDGVINRFEISPDSSVVAYVFGNEASPFRSDTRGYYFMATNLFIVDINDGTVLAQHDTNNFLSNLRFSPDSQSLIYIEETEDSARIFRLPVTGGTPVEINGPSAGGFLVDVDEANYTPDGNFVIYVGEQTVEGNDHLYSTEFFFAPSGFAAY
jgi:Tol biopolymer transport system component